MNTKIKELDIEAFIKEAYDFSISCSGQVFAGDCYMVVLERLLGKRAYNKVLKDGYDMRGQVNVKPLINYLKKQQENC